jgi:hypothetical protein
MAAAACQWGRAHEEHQYCRREKERPVSVYIYRPPVRVRFGQPVGIHTFRSESWLRGSSRVRLQPGETKRWPENSAWSLCLPMHVQGKIHCSLTLAQEGSNYKMKRNRNVNKR